MATVEADDSVYLDWYLQLPAVEQFEVRRICDLARWLFPQDAVLFWFELHHGILGAPPIELLRSTAGRTRILAYLERVRELKSERRKQR